MTSAAIFRLSCILALLPTLSWSAPTRVANTSLNLPADLPSGTYSTTNAFPGLSFTDPVVIVAPPGETNRLFIVEKPGRIAVIPDLSNPTREVFMDITARVRDAGNEEGLLGLAFHPNYNNLGQTGYGDFFVYYQTTISSQGYWRVSRFSVNPSDPDRGDAGSEVPLITQRDQAGNHNGGDLHFGDDGYLYISVGDEGGGGDPYDNGQHIDKDFFAAIFRIDVDQDSENLIPNTHAAVHANTYRVPADNPFVGATSFNGLAVTPADIRTEIWAIGLRNPWRMSFDRPTGRLFVADVGQVAREEINILDTATFAANGGIANYGWSFREGFIAYTSGPGGATPPAGFSAIDPIHDYPRSQGQSVTGGLVYRGSRYPELTGDYLFADYITGRIWTMSDPGGPSQTVEQIATDNNISAFGLHPQTDEILVADLGSDAIKRLVRTTGGGTQPPQFLSQTGAFSNLSNLTPEAGILPYDVNLPFWSDFAEKSRWFSIPSLSDDMTWSQDANWTFPAGQVWIKHFDLELNRDNPGSNRRRVETRFLVKTADDVYGVTYRWNDLQTDAELVDENGLAEDFDIIENGQARVQTWTYPSRGDCRTCHTAAAGGALSFTTRQLNRAHDYGSGPENQLTALEAAGYFTNSLPQSSGLPRFSAPDDEGHSLEHRARSFLSVNCVSCHQPGGTALGNWNARPEVSLEMSGIIDSLVNNNGGDPFVRTIVPGDPDNSMILKRLHAVAMPDGFPAMPPLGSNESNEEGIALLTEWIESIPKVLFVRGADRSGGFLEGNNDAERTEHLGDINNHTTGGRNHGWGHLANTLRNEGFLVEQITETAENSSGPSQGIHIDFENLNLDQYRIIVFGSNNAVYDTAAIDAIDAYVRGGGSALFISDANFGGDWADASNSDQQFLDRFGLVMNQDLGTYAKTRSTGEFLDPNHPIFAGVDEFHGEGVTPISIGTLPGDVAATVLAGAEGQVRRNTPPFGGNNQGPSSAATANDGALLVATAGQGKVIGHFDRNTFFNQGGAGSDITRFDNELYAINLFAWIAETTVTNPRPLGLSASDGTFPDRVELSWDALSGSTGYTIYRHTSDDFSGSSSIGTSSGTSFADSSSDYGTIYYYWVTATIDSTETDPSSSDPGHRSFSAPDNLTATDGTDTSQVVLTWSASSGASTYRVYRSTTDSFGSSSLLTSVGVTSHSDSTAAPGTIYFYWVTAGDGTNESSPGNSESGYRGIPAPTGLAASDGTSSHTISLSWNPVSGATDYRVWRATTNDNSTASVVATVGSTNFADNTVTFDPLRLYYYWVSARISSNESSLGSAEGGYVSFDQITDLTATSGDSADAVDLTWSSVSGASSYRILRSLTHSSASASFLASSTETSFSDTTAEPETTYFYFIEAENEHGIGSVSDGASGYRRLEVIQPDLLIGRSPGSLRGNDIYGTSSGQQYSRTEKRRRPITARFRMENDGSELDGIRLVGTRTNRKFRILYRQLTPVGANISSQVYIGSYIARDLPPAENRLGQIQVKPKGSVKRSRRTIRQTSTVRAFSTTDNLKRDLLKFNAKSRR